MTEERQKSDTPRTDEAAYAVIEFDRNGAAYVAHHAVTRDFARQIERELEAARKDALRYRWLRDGCADSPISVWACFKNGRLEISGHQRAWLAGQELDDAITEWSGMK